MKKTNSVVSIIALLLANLVYFMWLPYPKAILGNLSPAAFPSNLITNLIFFVLYAVTLVICVNSVLHPGERVTKKQVLISVPVIIGIQLFFDFIGNISERLLVEYCYIAQDLLTVAEILVFTLACVIIVKGATLSFKRFLIKFAALSIAVSVLFVIADVRSINEYHAFSDKYQVTVADLIGEEKNSTVSAFILNRDFLYQLRNVLLSSIISAVAILALYFSTKKEKCSDDVRRNIAHSVSRIFVLVVLASAICAVKMVLLPYDSLRITNIGGVSTSSVLPSFTYSADTTVHYRATGYGTKREVYHKTKYEIRYDGDIILTFDIDGETDGDEFELFDADGEEVRIAAKTEAVCYIKNNEPVCIKVGDIMNQEYDKTLLSVCELLLEKGRVSCFDDVGEYINRYDKDFLKPYVERWSKNEFTVEELSQLNGINLEYITQTAVNIADNSEITE